MSISPINNLSSTYIQSLLNTLNTGATSNATSASSVTSQPDTFRLSPFAQLLSTLQQLQQSDPAKYQQVTQQIAANLQKAAQTAQADGNTTAAQQLNQLATDFTDASKSGQLPNIQDLAQAVGGRHHHHHHSMAASADADGASTSSSGAASSNVSNSDASQLLSQLLSAFQASAAQNDSLNPLSIIMSTLSDAGITGSNG